MEYEILPGDVQQIDLLDDKGTLRLLKAEEYDAYPKDALRAWCHYNARYGLPTVELVDWLKKKIAGRKTIEIGSGAGDLAYHLGIPATDNRMQEWKEIKAYYAMLGQPPIQYPDFVEELDALDAILKYKPEIVIGSWITQWVDPDVPPPPGGGNIWGIKEDKILATGCTYILIGNLKIHGKKFIMDLPHQKIKLPFLRSRASEPELNRVWIWNEQ